MVTFNKKRTSSDAKFKWVLAIIYKHYNEQEF